MKKEVTIAILTHNRSFHFAQCIASIRQFTRTPYIIKILDTNSTVDHIEHMKQFIGPDLEFTADDDFLSCVAGRRKLLDFVDTEFVVFLDDDIRVAPYWLQNLLRPMRTDTNAGAVASNIVQEGRDMTSGIRFLETSGRHRSVRMHPVNFIGSGPLCIGGATMYRTDALRATVYRSIFSGGYEDWDQTLQLTQDLNHSIYGSRATVFHRHLPENRNYFEDRWRWRELMDAALGMLDLWNIRTAVDKVTRTYLEGEIVIPREQAERIIEVLI